MLDDERLWFIYNINDGEPDTLRLRQIEDFEDQYTAFLPAPGEEADIQYYLVAFDTSGVFSTSPVGAPFEKYSFQMGVDRIPPRILEIDSLPNSVFLDGELMIGARVTDNIVVDGVSLVWYWGRMIPGGVIALERSEYDSTLYTGLFQWSLEEAGIVHYGITAVDGSSQRNASSSRIRSILILAQVTLDDFEQPNRHWQLNGWVRSDDDAATGEYCLQDRTGDLGYILPRQAMAEVTETWDFSRFDRARLTFWEKHQFDSLNGEIGMIEIKPLDEDDWQEVLDFTGSRIWWNQVTLDLSDYCGENSVPIRICFRTVTPADVEPMDGWKIDHIDLQAGNYVGSDESEIIQSEDVVLTTPFPNPANSSFSYSYHIINEGKLRLVDVAGRPALELDLPPGSHISTISLNGIPAGCYLMYLSSNGKSRTQSIIILK